MTDSPEAAELERLAKIVDGFAGSHTAGDSVGDDLERIASLLRGIGAKEQQLPQITAQDLVAAFDDGVANARPRHSTYQEEAAKFLNALLRARASGSAAPPATSVGVSPSSGAPEEQHG